MNWIRVPHKIPTPGQHCLSPEKLCKLQLHHCVTLTACNLYSMRRDLGNRGTDIEAVGRLFQFRGDRAHRWKTGDLLIKQYPTWKKYHLLIDLHLSLYHKRNWFLHRLSICMQSPGQSGQRNTNTMLICELGDVFRFLAKSLGVPAVCTAQSYPCILFEGRHLASYL